MAALPFETAAVHGTPGRRVLPHNLEAEEAVIGGILFSGRALNLVAELLEPSDFYHPALQAIFEAMLELDQQSRPIDIITVAEQMRTSDTLSKLRAYGGEAYLAQLASKIATVENIAHHARIVRDKSTARRLIMAASSIVDKGYAEYVDVDRYVDEAQQAVFEVASRSTRQSYEPVRKVLNTAIRALEQRFNRKEAITGVPSGYTRFDELTAGLQPGDLIIVAARPSMGKTAFVMNCAQNAALDHGIPVLIFSLEMSKESLIERVLCSEARVDSQRLRGGFLETRDWINVTKAASRISEAPMWIDDSGAPTLMEIRAKCRRWRSDPTVFRSTGPSLGMIVVDYLQLIQGRPQTKESSREREISEISRGLKALAKELSLPVVALSQLNRSVEQRADKRPLASDLRESGAIEQDADLICFIYRDEVYNKDSPDRGIAEIIIGKQRNGPTGTVRLAFQAQYTRFENLAEGRE
ncbi:MAG: replicative DNA helicase [Myxococcales bacterium]|nr:replicative DNA helicase [Myxococcota bacterium]MDW8284211.1 replicative DNA helicase [Myxococcales bacterium]